MPLFMGQLLTISACGSMPLFMGQLLTISACGIMALFMGQLLTISVYWQYATVYGTAVDDQCLLVVWQCLWDSC